MRYSVGPDEEGKMLGLWEKSDWCEDSHDALAWTSRAVYPEPEVWVRLLEALLYARYINDNWSASTITSLKVPKCSPVTLTDIQSVIDKVYN